MSGKTARRARKNAVMMLDMYDVFTSVLCALMVEEGIDYDKCTTRQVDDSLRVCCNEFRWCAEELVRWVEEEDEPESTTITALPTAACAIQPLTTMGAGATHARPTTA